MKAKGTLVERYSSIQKRMAKVQDLSMAESVLSWDHQVYMPKNGDRFRAQQMATLKTMAHELFVESDFGEELTSLAQDLVERKDGAFDGLTPEQARNIELLTIDYRRRKKVSSEFVEEMAKVCGGAFSIWASARAEKNFSPYQTVLQKIVDLKKQEADLLGYVHHPYEALMEDFEPGLTVAKMDSVFEQVRTHLLPLAKRVASKQDPKILNQYFSKEIQNQFTNQVIRDLGYDFESGRADLAPHPFCTTFGPGDVRITLRVDEQFFNTMLFAGIHEAGHALYELGLPLKDHYGMPLGQAVSLAFHESQSRFWENNVGRSKAFWKHYYPKVQKVFPDALEKVQFDHFYRAINNVAPSFIRVEADELTYHAHILVRYEIERLLIEGSLKVEQIPEFWNDRYDQYLGIRPENDAEGCLQDVHWSYGSFGYFPTYSLGSFYAAQLMATAKNKIPDLERKISEGNFRDLLGWLRSKVHLHGRRYRSDALLEKVTGKQFDISDFIQYAKAKYES